MIEKRKLAVPKTTAFISSLPEGTQNIIRDDLKAYAREHMLTLDWDREARDYAAMTRRFCDMDEIYNRTNLEFCDEGEDIEAYENNQWREIVLKLKDIDAEELSRTAGRVGLSVSELLENFVGDLIGGTRTNGSDERDLANRWFERCWFSMDMNYNFLSYLVEWSLVNRAVKLWEELEDYKQRDELDECDLEEQRWIQEELNEMFRNYKDISKYYFDSFDNEMKRVLEWKREYEKNMGGHQRHSEKER